MAENIKTFSVILRVWRQENPNDFGRMVQYQVNSVTSEMYFLDVLDLLNEKLTKKGESPIVFESSCREGSCGTCGLIINDEVHGPVKNSTVCRLKMKFFKPDDIITVEPWRITSFPVIKDLAVNRTALERIAMAGGFISANISAVPEANTNPVGKNESEEALLAASCIGCGACVAACPNGSVALFLAAKIAHLSLLPQGQPEKYARILSMVRAAQKEGFGPCCNNGACENACPRGIKKSLISKLNAEYIKALFFSTDKHQ